MELFSKRIIKVLLKKYQVFPKKRFGQNFLVDKKIAKKIIKTANLREKDTILEIGPGIGNLTKELAKRVKPALHRTRSGGGEVIAIEKDPKMIEILKETTKNLKNVKIIQSDILKLPKSKLPTKNYKLVANLPYYIVSPVIRKFLENKNQPKLMVLMVQKEVAQRICATPPNMNLLAVSVQFYAKPKIISFVSKKSFWPKPKVDSAIIKIIPRKSALLSASIPKRFFRIAKAGFSQPRKQLINNLSKGLKIDRDKIKNWLLKNKVHPNLRAESLSLKDWINLTKNFPF